MLPIALLNVPQDAGQMIAFINQAVATYFNQFGPGLLSQQVSTIGSSTGGAVNLAAFQLIPAWMNGAVRAVRFRAWGATANNGNTKTLNLVLGGGSISLTQALTTSTANSWETEAIIQAAGANLQRAFWKVNHGAAILSTQTSTAGTETSTAAIALALTASTATANNDITCTGAMLELLQ